ncbi:hypothetical protein [Phaeodactylibacter xiamenensis]|uniref:hypothetical protein n=1 Tax=Phaeodactylibacter xiamenensis TaxID=1524460 RepID=UPI003CCC4405
MPRPLCDRLLTTHRPATLAPEPPPRQTKPRKTPPGPQPHPRKDLATDQPQPPPGKAWHRPAEVEVKAEDQPASPSATAALRPPPDDPPTGTARPKPPPRQPPPGRPRLALNLILAKTSPQTNLNLPQEKHGTAQLRLRLRLRLSTSLRHPVPRPLCDRLQADPPTGTACPQAIPPAAPARKTPRPALLAPSHRPGSHRQEDPAWPPALQRLGKIAGRRRPRSGADTLFEPIRHTT